MQLVCIAGLCLRRFCLLFLGIDELRQLKSDLQHRVTQYSARLIRQLKSRDRLLARIKRHCDVITAILQASSPKRSMRSFLPLAMFLCISVFFICYVFSAYSIFIYVFFIFFYFFIFVFFIFVYDFVFMFTYFGFIFFISVAFIYLFIFAYSFFVFVFFTSCQFMSEINSNSFRM